VKRGGVQLGRCRELASRDVFSRPALAYSGEIRDVFREIRGSIYFASFPNCCDQLQQNMFHFQMGKMH
jgi:hypothetical protein